MVTRRNEDLAYSNVESYAVIIGSMATNTLGGTFVVQTVSHEDIGVMTTLCIKGRTLLPPPVFATRFSAVGSEGTRGLGRGRVALVMIMVPIIVVALSLWIVGVGPRGSGAHPRPPLRWGTRSAAVVAAALPLPRPTSCTTAGSMSATGTPAGPAAPPHVVGSVTDSTPGPPPLPPPVDLCRCPRGRRPAHPTLEAVDQSPRRGWTRP